MNNRNRFRLLIICAFAPALALGGWYKLWTDESQMCYVSDSVTNGVPIPLDFSLQMGTMCLTNGMNTLKANLYLAENASQAFTSSAGFEKITNQTATVSCSSMTTSGTNMTVSVGGWYTFIIDSCQASSVTNAIIEARLFTNNVEVPRLGWKWQVDDANEQKSCGGNGMINIVAGSLVDMRIDVDTNTTLTFSHWSWSLINQ